VRDKRSIYDHVAERAFRDMVDAGGVAPILDVAGSVDVLQDDGF